METFQKNQPHIDPEKLRRVEAFFSQPDRSIQRANRNCSIPVEDLEDSDVLQEWLRRRQAGTNMDPIKQRIPLQESPQSDYLIELTRLGEPTTPSSLSNLTVPEVEISSINSVVSTPGQSRRSATLTPRRSSGIRNTPRILLQQKQIEKAKQNLAQQRRVTEEKFNPTASSTPCKQTQSKNFLSKLSLDRSENNEVNDNQISSSDEPSAIRANATNTNKETSENNKSESNKTAVEPVSTSQNDKTLVPCTQEQPNAIQSNEDDEEIIIPESQDTEEEPIITNPVQAPVNNSLRGSQQQQTNQQQIESNGMRTPPNSATGIPPAWARPILSTPKSAKNQSSRLPFWRKTPQTDTADKRSSVGQEIAQTNVLESTPTKSNRNNSFGQTLVVAVTSPSALSATPTVAMPTIQLNVNINGAMPQSPHLNGTANNDDGTISKIVELDQQPPKKNGSSESIMTNDSDPLSDDVDKENQGIETPRLDHTENIPARRQLVRSLMEIDVENSSEQQPIDNRTHTINNENAFEALQHSSKQSTMRSMLGIDSMQSNGSNILPPIDSRTFDKQRSNVGNATYDLSQHVVSTRASVSKFVSKDVSRRRNTIDVPDIPSSVATIVDLTTDSVDSSYDTDDADAEVAHVTGPSKLNASNGSSNHTADSIDRDEMLELSEDSDHQTGTQTKGTQIQINEKIAGKIQSEIQNGKIPAAFNPVVALKQLPADILGKSRTSITNRTQQQINIRESESFSHMIPPIDFRDESIIRDRSPESAIRDFTLRLSLIRKEQSKPVNPPSISNKKRRKKSINPELEAVNKTYAEIHQPRSSPAQRASRGRKLFTHQNEVDDPVENVSINTEASTSTSTIRSEDSDHDVFKKPLAPPPKKSKISLQLSKPNSANQSLNSTNTSQTDHEQSATNSTHSEATERPTEDESTNQMNIDEPIEFETDVQVQQSSKQPDGKTKTIGKPRAKSSSAFGRTNISVSNIIGDGDGARRSGRTKRNPNINCMRSKSIEQLKVFYDKSQKRKLSHAPSTTISHKRPKLSENQSSRSKSSENHSNRSKSSENHSKSTHEKSFKNGFTEEYIQKNILEQPWWKNLSDMSKKGKTNRNADEADLNIRKVGKDKRVESVNLDSIEFQEISDGFDISVIPTEREDRVHGYMRLKPSATKEAATAENETLFFIFSGEIILNADRQKWELIGGDKFRIKTGIEYEIQNVGTDVCVLSFTYHMD